MIIEYLIVNEHINLITRKYEIMYVMIKNERQQQNNTSMKIEEKNENK